MTVQKLTFLPAGRCLVDHSALDISKQPGVLIDLPIWSYLIETTDGPILVDTGMPDTAIGNPNYFGADSGILPKMTAEDAIVPVLKRAGYSPDDLLCLVSTHLHFDHAGGNQHFRNTPILLQKAEHEAAMHSDDYPPECKDPSLNYRLIEGDHDLVPGVRLLFTPGHTPGHQSLLVQTERSGPVLLTVDASYTRANFEEGVPFACWNNEVASRSVQRLQDIVKSENALVFYGHDVEQVQAWKTYPDFY